MSASKITRFNDFMAGKAGFIINIIGPNDRWERTANENCQYHNNDFMHCSTVALIDCY